MGRCGGADKRAGALGTEVKDIPAAMHVSPRPILKRQTPSKEKKKSLKTERQSQLWEKKDKEINYRQFQLLCQGKLNLRSSCQKEVEKKESILGQGLFLMSDSEKLSKCDERSLESMPRSVPSLRKSWRGGGRVRTNLKSKNFLRKKSRPGLFTVFYRVSGEKGGSTIKGKKRRPFHIRGYQEKGLYCRVRKCVQHMHKGKNRGTM